MVVPRPLPDLPGVYFAKVSGAANGRPSDNVFTFRVTPAPASGTADIGVANDVAVAISSKWPAFASGWMPQAYTSGKVTVYPLHTPLAPASVISFTGDGGGLGTIAPFFVGALVSHNVSRRGRGSQSRSTFTPILQAQIDTDHKSITLTDQALLQSKFDTFIAACIAEINLASLATTDYVQLSRGTVHAAPAVYPIIGSTAEKLLTTSRARFGRSG